MSDISNYYPVFPGKTLYRLPASLSAAGYVMTTSKAYRWDGRNRGPEKRVIWQYTLSGEGALQIGGKEVRVPMEHAMLLVIPEEHCYYLPDSPGKWEFCYLLMEGESCVQIAESLRSKYSSVIHLPSGGESVKTAETILDHSRHHLFHSSYQVSEEVFSFLSRMAQELETVYSEDKEEPLFIKRIFSHLQRNPDMTLEEMTAASGYSRLYLDRVFKQHTGKTPAEYIRDLKMRKAAGLLTNTLMNIKETAAECGFYDTAYFCRMFQKKFGKTPTQYRKMY